jgi:transcriptional regulator with XRE-family HTH domain
MDNNNEINQKVAKNLITYRKAAGLTQAEVAEKIHYSDKSVSKWESGNGIPDVYTLLQLSRLYGVSINAFLGEEVEVKRKEKSFGLQLLIMLLSSGIVWLVAIFSFALLQIIKPDGMWWLLYLYAILANAIVMLVYAAIWHHRIINFLSVTTIIWMALVCCFLTVQLSLGSVPGLWCIFLVGVPLQVLEILWAFFRSLLRKQRGMSVTKVEETPITTEAEG